LALLQILTLLLETLLFDTMYNLTPKARFASSVGNGLFNSASLDLHFAKTKSLVDATTGANLVDFTRASSGTYVDSEGVIRTATTNLLLRSEEFETTWGTTNASIAANTATAPNGTVTADTLIEDSTTGGHVVVQSISGAPDNTSFTSSCYCKALTRSWVAVTVVGKNGSINRVWFNLANGSQGTTNGTVTNFSAVSVGDGWYRIAVTASSATGGGNLGMRISLGSADNTPSYTGDGTSGIYIWGAQLEQSTTVGEYIPTTSTINSAPRFDHDPTTGESLGLLVEESRQNPAGLTASLRIRYNLSPSGSTDIVSSFALPLSGGLNANRFFTTGTTTGTLTGTGLMFLQLNYTTGQVVDFTIRVGYPQLEQGAFATSVIPTSGTTATRAADVASISGSNFSSWYRQDEGTTFAAYSQYASGGNIYTISDGTAANFITIQTNSIVNKAASANVFVASSNIGRIDSANALTANLLAKAAYGLSNGSRSLVTLGETAVTAANPATMPVVNRLFLGSNSNGTALFANGHIRRLTYWPARLPNSTLQTITQ
jgi:hypothetical protein